MTGYVRQDSLGNISNGSVIDANDLNNEFNAIVVAFNATVGHTHDGSPAEGAPITVVGPAQDFIASGSSFSPKTDDEYSLGTQSLRWSAGNFSGNVSANNFSANDSSGNYRGNHGDGSDGVVSLSPGSGSSHIGTTIRLRPSGSGSSTGQATLTNTGVFTVPSIVSNGSELTDLNASNLGSGIVPNGRISGNYTGFGNIEASGSLSAAGGSFNVTNSGHMTSVGNITSTTGAFGSYTGSVLLRPQGGGSTTNQTTIASNGNMTVQGSVTGTSFIGNINATSLNQGTVPNGRLSGSYTGITGTGALNAGSITSGFGNINIGSSTFTGSGSGISNLNASNLTTGTVNDNRIPNTVVRTSRTVSTSGLASGGGALSNNITITVTAASQSQAETGSNNTTAMTPLRTSQAITASLTGLGAQTPGTVSLMRNDSGGNISTGGTTSGSNLRHSDVSGNVGDVPTGSWRAMSITNNGQVGLFRRFA